MVINEINSVNKLYKQIDRHISAFKRRSGLSCVAGCGTCCLKSDLEVTMLEFLPAAYSIYLNGESDATLESIEQQVDSICVFYNPFAESGNCSRYKDRGLTCRLFGFAARADKHGDRTLVTCKIIKSALNGQNQEQISAHAPNMSSYQLRLNGINPRLSVRYLPINMAIKEAIETVLLDSRFRKKPA